MDFKKQVPYSHGDDGLFFIDIEAFKEHFLYFLVSCYRPNFKVNYYEVENDDSSLKRYEFKTTVKQDLHVAADTYDPRMYGYNCKTQKVMAQILVRKKGEVAPIAEKFFSDWIGFSHCFLKDLEPATYEIFL